MSCSVTTRRWRVTWRTSRTFGKPACPGTRRRRVSRAEVARVVADLASEADHESKHQHQARSEHALNRPYQCGVPDGAEEGDVGGGQGEQESVQQAEASAPRGRRAHGP